MEIALDIKWIRIDGGTQARAGMDQETVDQYHADMVDGDVFPPIEVYHDGERYWLADGFHRLAATKRLGQSQIIARVHQGTRRDAVLHAVGANAKHGLRRSNADKRRAVETLLKDKEWAGWADREIARRCHVSHPFVAKVRADLEPATGNVSSKRTYRRNGQVQRMDTAAIGNGGAGREPAPFPDSIPEPVVTTVSRRLFEQARESYSGHLVGQGRIKRPVRIGKLDYVCIGIVSGPGGGAKVKVTHVIPLMFWNTFKEWRPLTPVEVHKRRAVGPGYFDGLEVTGPGGEYVINACNQLTLIAEEEPERGEPEEVERRREQLKHAWNPELGITLVCRSRIEEIVAVTNLSAEAVIEKAVEELYYKMEVGDGAHAVAA